MDILVIGGSGLVGANVVKQARQAGHSVVGTYNSEQSTTASIKLDKRDEDAMAEVFETVRPDVVVDTAAFDDVDACETQRETAVETNVFGSYNAATAADSIGAQYITFSTDYVFPGFPDEAPYSESSRVSPINFYGRTRLAGEQLARVTPEWTVLRTSVIYGLASPNFATWALSELRAGNDVDIVDNQISTPTYAPELARATLHIATESETGLYHATGSEMLSRYSFTVLLAETYGLDTNLITPVSTSELGQKAPRPKNTALDSTKLYEQVGFEFSNPVSTFEAMRTRESNTSS